MAMPIMDIAMTDTTALLRLMSWLSPIFPIGGYAYSAGLEQAASDGLVTDRQELHSWIEASITFGALWNDAVIFCAAHRGEDVGDLCLALTGATERHQEMLDQGAAFFDAAKHWVTEDQLGPRQSPLPVIVARAAAIEGIANEPSIAAYLHAFVSNQLQCAIRLSITGQNGAAKTLAAMEPVMDRVASRAASSTLNDLGGLAIAADIAAMNHQNLQPRLFQS